MSDNETIADIVAEMRYGTIPKHRTDHELLALYADRIEAAWKREAAEREALALSVGGMVERSRRKPAANAAAMREALEHAKVAILAAQKKMGVDNRIILEIIDAALALPRRNCDVGTAEEQTSRFNAFCCAYHSHEECCRICPAKGKGECEFAWAQLPYEKGGAR